MTRRFLASLAALGWLAGCDAPARDSGEARMASMDGTAGGDAAAPASWDAIRPHLDSVVRLEPNRLVFVRAAHDSLARAALDRMDREMAAMAMPADDAWRALADSVRRDLAALDGLAGEAFVLRMRAHAGRLRRLIVMHERMMGDMPM